MSIIDIIEEFRNTINNDQEYTLIELKTIISNIYSKITKKQYKSIINIDTNEKMDILYNIINDNEYITNCVSNSKKDENSLSYLIDIKLSQSDCIKLGTGLEKILLDIILYNNKKLKNIKGKNIKGKKEKDHLFIDENNKIIYYAELKSNLNLDTEKCKSTSSKCISIYEELKIDYPDYKIKMYLVSNRHLYKNDIPKIILQKFSIINDNIVGINEYFNELNIPSVFDDINKYKEFLHYLVKKMYNI